MHHMNQLHLDEHIGSHRSAPRQHVLNMQMCSTLSQRHVGFYCSSVFCVSIKFPLRSTAAFSKAPKAKNGERGHWESPFILAALLKVAHCLPAPARVALIAELLKGRLMGTHLPFPQTVVCRKTTCSGEVSASPQVMERRVRHSPV